MKEIVSFDGDSIEYICNKCRSSQSNQSVTLKSLNSSINQMFQTIKGLAEDVGDLVKSRDENAIKIATLEEITTSLSNKLNETAASISNYQNSPNLDSNSLKTQIRSELIELRERDKRRDCIIIKGMTYWSDVLFQQEFNGITQSLINRTITLTDIAPINNRLIRARIPNKDDRIGLLTSSSKLQNSEYSTPIHRIQRK